MNTKSISKEDSDDYEDYDSFPSYRARSHTVTVSQPAQVEREYYYRNKARIAASKGGVQSIRLKKSPLYGSPDFSWGEWNEPIPKISRQQGSIINEPVEVTPGSSCRSRTSSFSSYFLPSSRPKSKPRMETTEQFWNRYRRQPRIHSFGSVMRQILFPVPRNNF